MDYEFSQVNAQLDINFYLLCENNFYSLHSTGSSSCKERQYPRCRKGTLLFGEDFDVSLLYSIYPIDESQHLRREGRGERQELGKRLFLVVGTGGLVGLR